MRELIAVPLKPIASDELRREGKVFFVGGSLPGKETLEAIFDSHCRAPAALFCLSFSDINSFHLGEKLAGMIKKNFCAHLLGRLDYPAPSYIIERAYAAGVDILDIPLHVFDQALSGERQLEKEKRLQALNNALPVFPRWAVVSTLKAGEEPSCSTICGIDSLLAAGIAPLVEISARAARYPAEEISAVFEYLAIEWRKHRVIIKPLLPLVNLATPLTFPKPRGVLKGLIEKIQDRKLLATGDLRRSLRVRQVEESFKSSGL